MEDLEESLRLKEDAIRVLTRCRDTQTQRVALLKRQVRVSVLACPDRASCSTAVYATQMWSTPLLADVPSSWGAQLLNWALACCLWWVGVHFRPSASFGHGAHGCL